MTSPSRVFGFLIFASSSSTGKSSSSVSRFSAHMFVRSVLLKPMSERKSASKNFNFSKSHSPVLRLRRRLSSFSLSRLGMFRYTTGTVLCPSALAARRRMCPPMTTFLRFGALFTTNGSTKRKREMLSFNCSSASFEIFLGLYVAALREPMGTYTTLMSSFFFIFRVIRLITRKPTSLGKSQGTNV